MPSGGFKLLDSAEVKMAFSGYTMFLGNNTLAPTNGGGGYSTSNNSWLSKTFSGKDSGPCLALKANEARQTDRSSFNTNHICAVAFCTPTQIAPSGPTSGAPLNTTGNNNNNTKNSASLASSNISSASGQSPSSANSAGDFPKFDPELIAAARTHRMNRDQCAIGEVYSLNPPQNQNQQPNNATSGAGSRPPIPCARVRDVETLVLHPPAVAVVGLYNNIATLFALVDPASHHPKASSEFQNGISDSEKLVSVQSVRFAARCTAFTTFTTHVDFGIAHGLAPPQTSSSSSSSSSQQQGPFQPYCELWSVFGFGSGDIIIWSHSQEAMLKRHNNSSTLTKDQNGSGKNNNNRIPSFVEPGVAVSSIARVDRGATEKPTCMKWAGSSTNSSSATSGSPSSSTISSGFNNNNNNSSTLLNTQVTCFCDLVVGYENGTILVISLNATGGFVNQNLSGWFGFSAIRSIRACPIAPYLLGVGFDDGSLKFLSFPWSFDVGNFEKELSKGLSSNSNNNLSNSTSNSLSSVPQHNHQLPAPNEVTHSMVRDLNATDIGTTKDPRVLCSVAGAVSGGSVTCVSWEANGEAVVCTGDDDAVSIVSIEITPSLRSLREVGNNFGMLKVPAGASQNSNNVSASFEEGKPMNQQQQQQNPRQSSTLGMVHSSKQPFSAGSQNNVSGSMSNSPQNLNVSQNSSTTLPFTLNRPLDIRTTAIHRRNFHRSWVCGSMILSLDVHNINPRTEQPELRTVTAVYTAALDGAVVAGAAFPAQQVLSNQKQRTASSNNKKTSKQLNYDNNNNNNTNGGTNKSASNKTSSNNNGGGLAIRHRPLARFLQMARNDTVLNFASIGDYNPESCGCFGVFNSNSPKSGSGEENNNPAVIPKQRKRSFVTVTAKGTVALWVFYDIAVENEVVKSS